MHRRIEHFNIGVRFNVSSSNFAGAFLGDTQGFRLAAVHFERHLLQIQDDIGSILDYTFNRREFMFDAFDLHRCDGRAFD